MTAAKRTSRSTLLIIASAAVIATTVTAPASAQLGGVGASSPPSISDVTCSTNCAGLDKVKPGSTLRVSGARMSSARKVVFLGKKGKKDDVEATVTAKDITGADVRIPAKAKAGKVKVVNGDGNESKPSPKPIKVVRASVKGKRLEARAESKRTFVFDGTQKTALRFFVGGNGAAQVTITLAHKGDPVALQTWTQTAIPGGSVRTVQWDGRIGALQAPDGKYEFRLSASSAGARASQANTITETFSVLSYRFPIDGPHKYGTGAARYGAKRGSGIHEGQDVFADCGTPLLAARGGVVLLNSHDSRGGNYIVIDGDADNSDFAYMHLRKRSTFAVGSRLKTGDQIGEVGKTGDADGCHLHFEDWPSGYQKGHTIDPQPLLKSWDK